MCSGVTYRHCVQVDGWEGRQNMYLQEELFPVLNLEGQRGLASEEGRSVFLYLSYLVWPPVIL